MEGERNGSDLSKVKGKLNTFCIMIFNFFVVGFFLLYSHMGVLVERIRLENIKNIFGHLTYWGEGVATELIIFWWLPLTWRVKCVEIITFDLWIWLVVECSLCFDLRVKLGRRLLLAGFRGIRHSESLEVVSTILIEWWKVRKVVCGWTNSFLFVFVPVSLGLEWDTWRCWLRSV